VRVDGKDGTRQELIDRAKDRLRNGNDVKVIVVRKGDRQPIVLRAADGQARTGVWVSADDDEDEGGEQEVFGLGVPGTGQQAVRVETDDGQVHVFGLGSQYGKVKESESGNHGESTEDSWQKVWTDADGKVHVETTIEVSPEGEHGPVTRFFGVGKDGGLHTLQGYTVHDGKQGEDARVQGFRLGGGSKIVTRGKDGNQVIELEITGDDGQGRKTYELQLDDKNLGKLLRKQAQDYYKNVDPDEFQQTIRKALKEYEAQRGASDDDEAAIKLRALGQFAEQDAKTALEQARKALEQLSDRELGQRTKRALEANEARGLGSGQVGRTSRSGGRTGSSDAGAFEPQARIEALKTQLEATRKELDVQRKQIQKLQQALKELSRQRDSARELR